MKNSIENATKAIHKFHREHSASDTITNYVEKLMVFYHDECELNPCNHPNKYWVSGVFGGHFCPDCNKTLHEDDYE